MTDVTLDGGIGARASIRGRLIKSLGGVHGRALPNVGWTVHRVVPNTVTSAVATTGYPARESKVSGGVSATADQLGGLRQTVKVRTKRR